MESLRTRRPSQPAARPQAGGAGGGRQKLQKPSISRPVASSGGARDARKSRIDDKIKKRMSMRYADAPPLRAPDVPDVPALPGARREREPAREPVDDAESMGSEAFDPEAYLKAKLATSTEGELRELQTRLQARRDGTRADLQRSVFRNYAEFVLIAKEISTLENDMLELKESLGEWKSMPELLKVDDTAAGGNSSDRRRTFRSSVADLKTLYASQLQTLHTFIEGSAKFVPATPGRHIVCETGDMVMLNSATYKVEYPVHFVLLDDSLLVARKRKQRGGGSANNGDGGKLVAERCWSLNEVVVVDVKDTADLTNVIKIRHAKEVHVFRTSRTADKKALLLAFRQVAEELAAKKRKEREGENERRKSVWAGAPVKSQGPTEAVPALPQWLAAMAPTGGASSDEQKAKAERDARWVDDFCDDLNVAIALREYSDAVQLIEKGEKNAAGISALGPKLAQLTRSLVGALLHDIASPTNRKAQIVQLAGQLARLRATPAAVTAFLQARTELARKRVRGIKVEGDIVSYVTELAIVVFCGVKHTADWFLAGWKENEVSSYFVQWAREQVEIFADLFRKQVYGSDVDRLVVEESLNVTRLQNKKLLQDNGLDFSFLLEDLLAPPASAQAALSHSRTNSLSRSNTYTLPPPEGMIARKRISSFQSTAARLSGPPSPLGAQLNLTVNTQNGTTMAPSIVIERSPGSASGEAAPAPATAPAPAPALPQLNGQTMDVPARLSPAVSPGGGQSIEVPSRATPNYNAIELPARPPPRARPRERERERDREYAENDRARERRERADSERERRERDRARSQERRENVRDRDREDRDRDREREGGRSRDRGGETPRRRDKSLGPAPTPSPRPPSATTPRPPSAGPQRSATIARREGMI